MNEDCKVQDLISIVVPIYNVAPYLDKCINSILNQTYKAIEIILVDDGSTDESGKICDDFAQKDERILVIHQDNGGITRARKAGVKASRGVYIGFVDGDDWIEPEMYETLYKDAIREHVQVVLSGVYRDNDEGPYTVWPATKCGDGLFDGERLIELKHHLRTWMNWASWNKLYEKKLLNEELEKVDDDLCGIEDDFFSAGCIARAERIFVEERVFYHGYDRMNSATHTRHDNYYLMMHRALPYYKQMMTYGDEIMKKELRRSFVLSLMKGVNEVFSDVIFPKYFFENKIGIAKTDVIALYGAGNVGECFYQQLKNYNVVKWVDRNLSKSSQTGMDVDDVMALKSNEFDKVLIAVLNENTANEIRQDLVLLGIEPEKIVWEKPKLVLEMLGL